jgi:2-polyprenyl-3-methyl-5-hydroxy-6-metoxy-1,4-benzoquinol methylase
MMKHIDPKVLASYNKGTEKGRLRKDLGLIEFARTKELLLEYLPPPPASVYDIGGGYGEYAWWLASLGYDVHLFDISETHIAMSAALGREYPGVSLRSAEAADALQIDRPGASADAVLCMGPLYHITEENERLAALKECQRLLRPGGRLFAAAITPYATLLWATTVLGAENRLLEEDAFLRMCEEEIETGAHIPPEGSAYRGVGRSFFHAPDALERELAAGGFAEISLHGVVGAGWLAPDLDEKWQDPTAREAILRSVRMLDGRRDILGLSTHLLATARKPEDT